ncbi:hypothetical protein WJX81_005502 [Elliptochloris bilobata]|uniref:Ribosome biogenesis regulatory protein n=1 Tax=Elliptochloris bilobata TaxID=381761 RepID=A0AAW1S5H7_9CHLO
MAFFVEAEARPADTAQQPLKVTAEQLGVKQGEEFEGGLDYDLGNMMACDPSPVDAERLRADPSLACLEMATRITQSLVARLFELPSEAAPVGRIAQLPPPTHPLPRHKPLPAARAPTRWEAFAAKKGIQKKKRPTTVWDEDAGEWRRRHGYKRASDAKEVPIIEASAEDKEGEDPFTRAHAEKRERVKAQAGRQLANAKASAKAMGARAPPLAAALPPTLQLAASLPEHGRGRPVKRREIRDDIKAASRQAGVSTASGGKFDAVLPGEKPGERAAPGKCKRPLVDKVADRSGTENTKVLGMVDKILRERADDILDVGRAVRGLEGERRAERSAAKASAADADEPAAKKRRPFPNSTKGQRFAPIARASAAAASHRMVVAGALALAMQSFSCGCTT